MLNYSAIFICTLYILFKSLLSFSRIYLSFCRSLKIPIITACIRPGFLEAESEIGIQARMIYGGTVLWEALSNKMKEAARGKRNKSGLSLIRRMRLWSINYCTEMSPWGQEDQPSVCHIFTHSSIGFGRREQFMLWCPLAKSNVTSLEKGSNCESLALSTLGAGCMDWSRGWGR